MLTLQGWVCGTNGLAVPLMRADGNHLLKATLASPSAHSCALVGWQPLNLPERPWASDGQALGRPGQEDPTSGQSASVSPSGLDILPWLAVEAAVGESALYPVCWTHSRPPSHAQQVAWVSNGCRKKLRNEQLADNMGLLPCSSAGWKPDGGLTGRIRCCRAAFLLEALGVNLSPYVFQFRGAAYISWIVASSAICKASSFDSNSDPPASHLKGPL